ncbi:MAG: YbaN family protein [Tenuifilum sp.]|uniref:YbaN family protein n=1 Tax=Tenuifilum sp. TaxID=2760880 RepID=UPI003CA8369B
MELHKARKAKSPVLRALFVIFGIVSFGLGVLGIFLPLLPTTPFMLLSAFLFIRSSGRLYRWLINHRLFGKYIHDYIERRSIPRRVKWYTLGLLWASILTSVATLDVGNVIRLMLLLIAVGVTAHVVKLRNS